MAEFIKVRSKDGPKTEYLAPKSLVESHPDRYIVVDGKKSEVPAK